MEIFLTTPSTLVLNHFDYISSSQWLTICLLWLHALLRLNAQLAGCNEPNIRVFSYPGAKLTEVVLRSMHHVYDFKPTTIIYMAGINDISVLNPITRKVSLRFRHLEELMEHLSSIFKSTRDLLANEFPNTKVIFAGIIGIDLAKYNHMLYRAPDQDKLNDFILEVNKLIRSNNVDNHVTHVYFTAKVHKWEAGLCQHRYHLLYDGLHPGPVVIDHWLKLIIGLHHNVSQ